MLFTLFISDLEDALGGGVFIDNRKIKALIFADDLVVFSEKPGQLQSIIKDLEEYCDS